MATWRSADFGARLDEAVGAGLVAAAEVVREHVSDRLAEGYTSGDFVTGASAEAVAVSGPDPEDDGLVVRIGTPILYNLFWELGHRNIFTRRYERVEVWVPLFLETTALQEQAFRAAFAERMAA
jgi:hypothetical protein